jgi:uncharacterized protein (DUF885 family)
MTERHPVYPLADHFVDELSTLRPTLATALGIPGHDARWDDTSPAGIEEVATFLGERRAALDALPATEDKWDRLAVRVFGEYIQHTLDPIEHFDHQRDLGHLQGTFVGLRETFAIMDATTEDGWRNIATRLATIGQPLAGLRACLEDGMAADRWAAKRQACSTMDQLRASVGPDGAFTQLVAGFPDSGVEDTGISDALRDALDAAKQAVEAMATWLEQEYVPRAPEADGVGADRYRRHARSFLGTDLDLDETYRWGWDHLMELRGEMDAVAEEIRPGSTLAEVVQALSTDPATLAGSPEEFRSLMLERERQAMRDLEGTHFDIPEEIRTIDVRLAPKGAALGAYFIPPSEDFSRPGTTWWSLGDKEQVPIWDEVTTAYHEGFPGHHLQCGLQVCLGDRLTRVHRLLYWLSGYGEGWALYAERLMRELGYLDRPEFVLGLLASNALRAVRVVIDIGSHLDLPIPDDVPFRPGERWTFDTAVESLERYAFLTNDVAVSEITRYLGWPGQAIAYKVGERVILGLRDEVRGREGDAFDLKAFHERVLGSGPVGLDHLRDIVLN